MTKVSSDVCFEYRYSISLSEHGVFFVKYCSVLLQALTIEADEDFLFSVFDLTKIKGASWDMAQEE